MSNKTKFVLRRTGHFITAFLSVILGVILFTSRPDILFDINATAFAFMALVASSFVGGRYLYKEEDRALALGAIMGIPFGFFFSQGSTPFYPQIASGANNIIMLSGAIFLASSLWPWVKSKIFKKA
jgi:hypothetical protein